MKVIQEEGELCVRADAKRAGGVLLIQTLHCFSINIPEKAVCFRISHLNFNLKKKKMPLPFPFVLGLSGYDETNEVGLEQEAVPPNHKRTIS